MAEPADRSIADGRPRPDRRSLLAGATAITGALWVAPSLLSFDVAMAQTSLDPPAFVPGSAATAFSGPSFNNKSISLTSGSAGNPVQAGDLWVAYLSYDERGTIAVPAGWTSSAVAAGNSGGAGAIYSVESVVVWRILTTGDIVGGAVTQGFTAAGANLTYGGFRGSAVVYRGNNLIVTSQVDGVGQGAGTGSTVAATFPANAATAPNVVLRLGAGRGYGGYTSISWNGGIGTDRVDVDAGNSGDRAQVINEQVSDAGAAQNRDIDVGLFGNRSRTTATLVIKTS